MAGSIARSTATPSSTAEPAATTNGFDNLNASSAAHGTIGSLTQFVSFSLHPTDENTILGGSAGQRVSSHQHGHDQSPVEHRQRRRRRIQRNQSLDACTVVHGKRLREHLFLRERARLHHRHLLADCRERRGGRRHRAASTLHTFSIRKTHGDAGGNVPRVAGRADCAAQRLRRQSAWISIRSPRQPAPGRKSIS